MKKSQYKFIKIVKYSLEQGKDADKLRKILKVSGRHNVYNSLAALTAARALGISDEISFKVLSGFRGAWRRFEEIGHYKGAVVISDYAHNPEKIRALADALICKMEKEKQQGGVILVFQPHHQQRLETLFDDFVEAFGDISKKFQVSPQDKLTGQASFKFQGIITDVYEVAGREQKLKSKNEKLKNSPAKIFVKNLGGQENSKTLVDTINKKYPQKNIIYVPKQKLKQYIEDMFHAPCSMFHEVVFMGAGDIDTLAREFLISKP